LDDTFGRASMVPRTAVGWLDSGTTLAAATEVFIRSGYSRIPLIGDSPDDVLGIIFLKDIIRAMHMHKLNSNDAVNLIAREIRVVPESKTVWDLLQELQSEAIHAAVGVDENGGNGGEGASGEVVDEEVGD